MRIALIDPSLFTLPYDQALARGLTAAGHDVVLHGRRPQPSDGGLPDVPVSADFYRIAGSRLVSALPDRLRLLVKGVDHAWSMLALLARLRRDRPDAIHFQWLPLPMLDGRLLSRFRAIAPLLLTVHDSNPFNGDPSAGLQAPGFQRCLRLFDQLIVHTAQGEARLRAMGIPHARISVRPHGMLCNIVAGAPDPMLSDPITFVLFGKIKPYKGPDLLLRAFAGLPPALRAQARLRIVGKPYMDMAPLEAAAGAMAEASIETGFVADSDVPALFGPGTVAVFPYREIEASGVMFLALANGRPIIASRLGGFAETIVDGQHGRLLPAGDVAQLTAAMAEMIADRSFAANCARSVRALADAIPSWGEIARDTAALYEAATLRRRLPRPGLPNVAAEA